MTIVSHRGILAKGLFVLLLSALAACTPEQSSRSLNRAHDPVATKSVVGLTAAVACHADDWARFERPLGEPVDLERENLPRGLFLAALTEMRIEKKAEVGGATRVIVREESGGKSAEIVCAEGLGNLGVDFEMALTGLVKFKTTERPEGDDFTSRQFFFFQDKDGYGAVLSNPKQLSSRAPLDLRKLLRASVASPQLFRTSDRSYVLKYSRERDGIRGQLLVYLEVY